MRFHQIVGAPAIILTNEENRFVKSHHTEIPLSNLFDHEQVVAQNLVRKGIYTMSDDNSCLILKSSADSE